MIMATKVKGEAIKEGSIPLSALTDNVKELLNNSVGFKEFCGYISLDVPLEIQAYTGGDYYYVKIPNDIVEIEIGAGITPISYGPPFSIKYISTNYPKAELSIITDYPEAHKNLKIPVFRGINSNEVFIPDTVVKTTPQELSDDNKNQALTNLGIDPVVWKYIKSPCYITNGKRIPNDLLDENGVFKYYNKNMFYLDTGVVLDVGKMSIKFYQLYDDLEVGITQGLHYFNLNDGVLSIS